MVDMAGISKVIPKTTGNPRSCKRLTAKAINAQADATQEVSRANPKKADPPLLIWIWPGSTPGVA